MKMSSISITKHQTVREEEEQSEDEETDDSELESINLTVIPAPCPPPTCRLDFDMEYLREETKHLEVFIWTLFEENLISLREMESIKLPVEEDEKCKKLYKLLEKKLKASISAPNPLSLVTSLYEIFLKTENGELNKAIRVVDLKQQQS